MLRFLKKLVVFKSGFLSPPHFDFLPFLSFPKRGTFGFCSFPFLPSPYISIFLPPPSPPAVTAKKEGKDGVG